MYRYISALRMPRWRRFAWKGILALIFLGAICAGIEHMLELRDASRLTVADTFYSANGRRIRYRLTGEHNPGPTVVLLDGLTATLEQWGGVQEALSTESPVLSYDRYGGGFSDLGHEHGAIADAEELDQLLHAPGIARSVVLVGYSSSSMMAAVFAARHPDVVKGLVFVEPAPLGLPALPAPDKKTYRRVFWRFNVVTIESFFGYTRLRLAMTDHGAGLAGPAAERYDAAVRSSHHWLASTYEAMSLDQSVIDADAAMASHPFVHLPLAVLVTTNPAESSYLRAIFERDKTLAESSERGALRLAKGDHHQLLLDPDVRHSTVNLIRTIVAQARGGQNAL